MYVVYIDVMGFTRWHSFLPKWKV